MSDNYPSVSEIISSIISPILKILSYIIPFGLGLSLQKILNFCRIRRLRAVLSLKWNQKPIRIIVPTRNGNIAQNNKIDKTSPAENYVTYNELQTYVEAYNTLSAVSTQIKERNFITCIPDERMWGEADNAFMIGGFFANSIVQNFFVSRFVNVNFSCSQATYDKYKNTRIAPSIRANQSDSDHREIYINDKRILSYNKQNEGYIILIKLTGKTDFQNCDHGVYHICFGNSSETTHSAIKCYSEFTSELHKRLKKRKKHYFVIIKCKNNEPDFHEFYDCTDDVFT